MHYTRRLPSGNPGPIVGAEPGTMMPRLERKPMTRLIHAVRLGLTGVLGAAFGLAPATPSFAAWEPTQPIEIIVPAGPGGGADQMARVIQEIATKHKLTNVSMKVVNKAGGAGGDGFLDVKGAKGNPHKLVITLSNLF